MADDATPSAEHLSYYKPPEQVQKEDGPAPPPPKELSKTRLYVGNLHPTVNEYALLQIFSKYGKIAKLDFLFHKSGPSKGKPRGFAFIEFSTKEDAMNALVAAHDRPLRGRKLVVTFANQAPENETYSYVSGCGRHGRRPEPHRPTTLSLLKAGAGSSSAKTESKIAALEAKLRQMEKEEEPKASTLPVNDSLPLRPPPSLLETQSTAEQAPRKLLPGKSTPNVPISQKPVGILASGSNAKLGKKPTLEELMRSKKAGSSGKSRGIFG